MTPADAQRIAAELDLDVDALPVCLACLSSVSMAVDTGDESSIRGALFRVTPDLWAEGLEAPARAALERLRTAGVAGAREAVADVVARGPRSPVARAIVRRLGEQLWERAQGDLLKMGWQPWPPPDLNGAVT